METLLRTTEGTKTTLLVQADKSSRLVKITQRNIDGDVDVVWLGVNEIKTITNSPFFNLIAKELV